MSFKMSQITIQFNNSCNKSGKNRDSDAEFSWLGKSCSWCTADWVAEPPFLQCQLDGQQLLVADILISLSRGKLPRKKKKAHKWTLLSLGKRWDSMARMVQTPRRRLTVGEIHTFGLHKQLILQQTLKNLPDMLLMLFSILGKKNQNIIQTDKHKAIQHVTQNFINHGLKKGWYIT